MNNRRKKSLIALNIFIFTLVIAWGIKLELFQGPRPNIWNNLYSGGYALLYFIGAITGLAGAFRASSKSLQKTLFFLGLSLLSYSAILTILTYIYVSHIRMATDILAYLFFPIFYPLLAIASWQLAKLSQFKISGRILIETVLIFLISFFALNYFLYPPDNPPTHVVVLYLLYFGVDALMLSLAYIVARTSQKINSHRLFLVLGLLTQVSADIIYNYRFNHRLWWRGDLGDKFYALSGFLFTLATILLVRHKEPLPNSLPSTPLPTTN